MAVCLLGAGSHRLFGYFAPGFGEMGEWMVEMGMGLRGVRGGFRCRRIGGGGMREGRGVEVMFLNYWRLIEDLVGSFLLDVVFFASSSHGRG